jgi:hypothetical protein
MHPVILNVIHHCENPLESTRIETVILTRIGYKTQIICPTFNTSHKIFKTFLKNSFCSTQFITYVQFLKVLVFIILTWICNFLQQLSVNQLYNFRVIWFVMKRHKKLHNNLLNFEASLNIHFPDL